MVGLGVIAGEPVERDNPGRWMYSGGLAAQHDDALVHLAVCSLAEVDAHHPHVGENRVDVEPFGEFEAFGQPRHGGERRRGQDRREHAVVAVEAEVC